MSPSTGNGNPGPPDSLDDVSLVYFDASPTHLGPFEASRLRWKVDAPDVVRIELAGTGVAHVGEQLVEPPATRTYDLVAKAWGASKLLKRAQVTVDLSPCLVSDLNSLGALIQSGLSEPDVLPSGVYFREDPKVTISPGQIQIHLFMGKFISSWVRDPDITIDMSFGLTVVPDNRTHGPGLGLINAFGVPQTRLAPVAEVYTASVTEPWYVWAIPLYYFPLALALAMAQDGVSAQVPGIIQRVVDGLDADFHPDNFSGLAKHTVTIDVDDRNVGYLEANWCPPPPVLVKEEPQQKAVSARRSNVNAG